MKELIKLLKEGKTINEAKRIVSESYSEFTHEIVESSAIVLIGELSKSCLSAIPSLFSIENGKELSTYTVGEVRDLLLEKGFPREVVTDTIVTYLESERLSIN